MERRAVAHPFEMKRVRHPERRLAGRAVVAGRREAELESGVGTGWREARQNSRRCWQRWRWIMLKAGPAKKVIVYVGEEQKYHGASADVADKIAARLREDFEKARKLTH